MKRLWPLAFLILFAAYGIRAQEGVEGGSDEMSPEEEASVLPWKKDKKAPEPQEESNKAAQTEEMTPPPNLGEDPGAEPPPLESPEQPKKKSAAAAKKEKTKHAAQDGKVQSAKRKRI